MARQAARTLMLACAVGLGLTVFAPVAAPAHSLPLAPGAVSKIVVRPDGLPGRPFLDGSIRLSWKAPPARPGRTAKVTSYKVRCGSVAAVTKVPRVHFDSVTDVRRRVTCSITPYAGKVPGRSVSAPPIVTYHAYGASVLTYDKAISDAMAHRISAGAPAISAIHGFAVPMVTNLDNFPAVLRHEGTLRIGLLQLRDLRLLDDAAGTTDEPVEVLVGMDTLTHQRITVLTARSYDISQQTFVAHAPTDAKSLAWLHTAGLEFTADQTVGVYRMVALS
jgi:hypothetical protein